MKACVTDWDGTLRRGFLTEDWLLHLTKTFNVSSRFYDGFVRSHSQYVAGQIIYDQFALDAENFYANAMKGLKYVDVKRAADQFAANDLPNLFPFVQELLKRIKEHGYSIFVISGGPLLPLLSYSSYLPINDTFAVDVEKSTHGIFTSKIVTNYALRTNKYLAIEKLKSIGYEIVLAFGDTEADSPLLESARFPFVMQQHPRALKNDAFYEVDENTVIRTIRDVVFGGAES